MQNEKIIHAIAEYLDKVATKDSNGFLNQFTYGYTSDIHAAKILAVIAPHLEARVNTTKIREAFARYVDTEGCSCCRDSEGHEVAEKELAELLKPLPYVDSSGWDWDKPA